MAKDIVYIDIDDEITAVIDKLEASKSKVVALVLPKHATTFLSTVNMKLLKRAADNAKKSVVIITSDPSIIPLAAIVKLHVAKTLSSKPAVPPMPKEVAEKDTINSDEFDEVTSGIAAAAIVHEVAEADTTNEVIELDNTDKKAMSSDEPTTSKNKKLRVPDFSSFRLRLFLGIFAIILIIVGWVFAFIIMPKATVTLKTEVTTVESTVPFTATTELKDFDSKNPVIPATLVQAKKTDTEKSPATGKKDVGTKASGSVRMYNCNIQDKLGDVSRTVPSGSLITDSGGNIFITQSEVVVDPSSYIGSTCSSNKPSASVIVIAQNSGEKYNLSARSYSVGGFTTITAKDSTGMGGGTSKIVTVISAEDIESTKQRVLGKSKTAAITDLQAQLDTASLMNMPETLTETSPVVTVSAAVGAEAADVTVTSVITYTMLGIKQDDLKVLVEANIASSITDSKQKILNNGLDAKTIKSVEKKSSTDQKLSASVIATVGPDIDTAALANELAGKTRGEIQNILVNRAGIKDVSVAYSPVWVSSTPKKASKINIVIEQVSSN